MSHRQSPQQGFSLVELLVVVGIIALVAGFLLVGFKNYASFQQYNQAVSGVSYTFTRAKQAALSAEGDENHGVRVATSSLTHFVGSTYVAGDPQNETTNYNLVTFQTTFTNGVDEIIFNKLTGLPSATGTIVISGVDFSASTTVEITETGVIQ